MGYDALSSAYDLFTDGFDYEEYLDFILDGLSFADEPLLALDCGCGTGTLMSLLFERGFDPTGVDISAKMLSLAREKLNDCGCEDPLLVCQDISKIDLYGAYHLAVCSLDTLNHITDIRKLNAFCKRIGNFVEPNGYFVFDLKDKSLFQKTVGTSVYEREGNFLVMEGYASGDRVFYTTNVFSEESDGRYSRQEEYISERYYPHKKVIALLEKGGLSLVDAKKFHGRTVVRMKNIKD